MANGLDSGDSLRRSDKFKFFRGNKTDSSAGERYVPFEDLFTLLNNEGIGGGGPSQEDVDRLEQNIGLNSLRDAVNGGWAWFNMVDGVADVFTDQTGIDGGSASNIAYDAAGDYYEPATAASATFLLQSDTTDGSTTFVDTADAKTITVNGETQHDTDQAKFGASSILFDGTTDYLDTPDSADWDFSGGDDYTIDFWVRPTTTDRAFLISAHDFNTSGWTIEMQAGGNVRVHQNGSIYSFGFSLVTNTWQHVAVTKSSGTVYGFVDGDLKLTQASATTPSNVTEPLRIGAWSSGILSLNGHMDEIRILKGTADWTANFTPPASSYSLAATNMTLPSIEFTTQQASPASARSVVLYDPIDAVTLNTDLILEFSRDSGTTWTTATLEADAVFSGNVEILVTDDIDISAQPAGTGSIIWRITTANTKNLQIHGVYLQWR